MVQCVLCVFCVCVERSLECVADVSCVKGIDWFSDCGLDIGKIRFLIEDKVVEAAIGPNSQVFCLLLMD